jgi:hypothetical protein
MGAVTATVGVAVQFGRYDLAGTRLALPNGLYYKRMAR